MSSRKSFFNAAGTVPATLLFATLLFTGCDTGEIESSVLRLISRIEHYQDNGSGVALYQMVEYRYDSQDRMTEMKITGEDGITTQGVFSYPANSLAFGSAIYTLNSDGSIASWSTGDLLTGTCTYSNGYLKQREYYVEFETIPGIISGTTTETYTWEQGNIATIAIEQSYPGASPWTYSLSLIFEYGSIQNRPCSIDFFLTDFSVPKGWYGKPIRYLPFKWISRSESGADDISIYRYETDSRGYPTRIFVQTNGEDEELRTVIYY